MKKRPWRLIRNLLLFTVFGVLFINFVLIFSNANAFIVRIGTISTISVVLGIYAWAVHNKNHLPKLAKNVHLMALIGATLPILLSLVFNFDIDSHTNLKIHNLMLIIVGMEIVDLIEDND